MKKTKGRNLMKFMLESLLIKNINIREKLMDGTFAICPEEFICCFEVRKFENKAKGLGEKIKDLEDKNLLLIQITFNSYYSEKSMLHSLYISKQEELEKLAKKHFPSCFLYNTPNSPQTDWRTNLHGFSILINLEEVSP